MGRESGGRNEHGYEVEVRWTGNLGEGTRSYRGYSREHEIRIAGKPVLTGSADPAFRGDASRHNPEDMLVSALSACHMLWYLHLCADAGISVEDYRDCASGTMVLGPDGGRFTEVVLRPAVALEAGADRGLAEQLHERAHELCFIARSVSFPVRCEPEVTTG